MIELWFLLGFIGWISLMVYRYRIDGKPKNMKFITYIPGFLFALFLGPACFLVLIRFIHLDGYNDKTSHK
jgi:hypothetical protein